MARSPLWQRSQAGVHLDLHSTQPILLFLSVVEALLVLQHALGKNKMALKQR